MDVPSQYIHRFDLWDPTFLVQQLSTLPTPGGPVFLQDADFAVVGICPRWILQSCSDGFWQSNVSDDRLSLTHSQPCANPWQVLETYWSALCVPDYGGPALMEGFCGGLLGFLGYELMAQRAQGLSAPSASQRLGGMWLGDFDIFLRKESTGWVLYGPDQAVLRPLYDQIIALLERHPDEFLPCSASARLQDIFRPQWSYAQYRQAFIQIQDYLHAGDCYQVNLTQPFVAPFSGSLLPLARPLWAYSRAPYAGWMCLQEGMELLSCSPELFLQFLPTGEVITRPIKGTRPRAVEPNLDAKQALQLSHSEKDRAENLMIVDLLRNDLGQHTQTGSVRVPTLFEVQSFAQVHHLVSEVRAQLERPCDALSLLLDALPGGSITGAPKVRALQIIDELEAGSREAYCGSMGYLNRDGSGRWNILIRTLQLKDGQLSLWVGGGITAASDCASEYQECLDKVGGLMSEIERLALPSSN